jgi:rubrerythrin
MTIQAHCAVPKVKRDLDWLRSALQLAIAVEHSTLPFYLTAVYSLKVQNYSAYNALRSVAMEEMVHMAVAANILAALGGRPQIKTLSPTYPSQGLPGGAEPDLYMGLAKLSKRQLANFMRLESPAFLLPEAGEDGAFPTVAALYAAISAAIHANADAVRAAIKAGGGANQVGDDIGFAAVTCVAGQDPIDQFDAAIAMVVSQGAGTATRPLHADGQSENEASHYCKFAEIFYGRQFQKPEPEVPLTRATEPLFFQGYRLPFPEVVNLMAVPNDGYAKLLAADPNGVAVETSLQAFDAAYSAIMAQLDDIWNGPAATSWPTLGQAVEVMGKLRVLGCFNIMKYQVPPDLVSRLAELYPGEYPAIAAYSDLEAPLFYGPRFRNTNPSQL